MEFVAKNIANCTKGNVAGCPKLKSIKPLLVIEERRDPNRIIIIRIGQWQYIGTNFPSNDPLHLFGQRYGKSCASMKGRPYIPMGLI